MRPQRSGGTVVTPIAVKTLVMCALTVFSVMPRLRAICLFGSPPATSRRTSRSRAVSVEPASGVARVGGARIEGGLAARGGADAAQELFGFGVFEQVAARTGVERAEHLLAIGEPGDDHDLQRRARAQQPARGLDAVHAGHREIDQDHVGS
jgi:hypothetical protein